MMSLPLSDPAATAPTSVSPSLTTPPAGSRRPWLWAFFGCTLLVTSGAVRNWQERRFDLALDQTVTSPFPLSSLPTTLGGWKADPGDAVLDPQIARIAGSADSLVRSYTDRTTGVTLTLLVIFGRAEQVVGHTPEICYPAVGYQASEETLDLPIPGMPIPSRFRSLVFTRSAATGPTREEVLYAFRQNGQWNANVSGNWRVLRTSPPLYKVQVRRRTANRELREISNPIGQFLTVFLPELERRINQPAAERVPPPSPRSPN